MERTRALPALFDDPGNQVMAAVDAGRRSLVEIPPVRFRHLVAPHPLQFVQRMRHGLYPARIDRFLLRDCGSAIHAALIDLDSTPLSLLYLG